MRQWLRVSLLFCCVASGSAWSQSPQNGPGPLGDLPPHLTFAEGKVSWVLDPQGAVHGVVPLYMVNDTAEPASFVLPYEFPVREVLGFDGVWRRAMRYPIIHCHDDKRTISSFGFYLFHLPLHSKIGRPEKVRVRLYGGDPAKAWISNEITAVVDPAEVEACRYDDFGLMTGPIEDAVAVALGKVKDAASVRDTAIRRLGQIPVQGKDVELLKEVISAAKTREDTELFSAVCSALLLADAQHEKAEPFWTMIRKEVTSGVEPWAGEALSAIGNVPNGNHPKAAARKRALLESILADPRHAQLHNALWVYTREPGGALAKARLERIARSRSYPATVRDKARRLLDAEASR